MGEASRRGGRPNRRDKSGIGKANVAGAWDIAERLAQVGIQVGRAGTLVSGDEGVDLGEEQMVAVIAEILRDHVVEAADE